MSETGPYEKTARRENRFPRQAQSSKATGDRVSALRYAIESGEILPYYQPIVDLRSHSIVGFEVLARWIRPRGHELRPADFIPLATSAGLLNLLTQSLLKTACCEAARWPSQLTLSINLAPSQFPDDTLPDMIESSARSKNFPLSRLVLEITEGLLRGSPEKALARTKELRSLGISLAMDDFGIGDSNIRRLGLVQFDIIKIDRCVIRSVTLDKSTHRGLIAAIAVAKSLGLQVIAEGVEENWQALLVQSLGCSIIQGWLAGRPMPASDVRSFIAARDQGRRLSYLAHAQPWLSPDNPDISDEHATSMARVP